MPAQPSLASRLPALSYLLLAIYLVILAFRTHNDTTMALVVASVVMFACCWASATHLLGARPALQFVLIAVSFGWFAEQMGSSRGWFFGRYTYTDVLGVTLGDVPLAGFFAGGEIARHHHEKVNGAGYPQRLSGAELPLLTRMSAICDVYDAITSNRPYKRGWDPAESIARMASWKGHLDPVLFGAFVKSLGIYPTGSVVKLQSGKLAENTYFAIGGFLRQTSTFRNWVTPDGSASRLTDTL